jgi:hypothetical protein
LFRGRRIPLYYNSGKDFRRITEASRVLYVMISCSKQHSAVSFLPFLPTYVKLMFLLLAYFFFYHSFFIFPFLFIFNSLNGPFHIFPHRDINFFSQINRCTGASKIILLFLISIDPCLLKPSNHRYHTYTFEQKLACLVS